MPEEDELEEIRRKLRAYKREDIIFNEPHFTNMLLLREGNKEEVVRCLLEPDQLVYSYEEEGRYGDVVHCLHFKISNTRTMRLPVIFDRNSKKSLYIITYILRYRPWQSMIRAKRGRR